MDTLLQELTNNWLQWLGPLVLVGASLWIDLDIVRRLAGRNRLPAPLRRLSRHWLHDVLVDGGTDEPVHLAHAALLPGRILVLDYRDFPGAVFAAERMEQWVQSPGGGGFPFANPLPRLESAVAAVREAAGDPRVEGRVVFSDAASFPKGRPGQVGTVTELVRRLAPGRRQAVPEGLRQAWERLRARTRPAQHPVTDPALRRAVAVRAALSSLLLVLAAGWWLVLGGYL